MSAPNPFAINVTTLRAGARREEHRSGPLPDLTVSGSAVPAGAVVEVDAVLEAVHGGVVVSADVAAPWVGECRRCLRPIAGQVCSRVRELYENHSDGEET